MAQTIQPGGAAPQPVDDYRLDPGAGQTTQPASHHVLAVLNFLLLVILAAISFSLFWVVATILGFV